MYKSSLPTNLQCVQAGHQKNNMTYLQLK